jgi:transposase-like protein
MTKHRERQRYDEAARREALRAWRQSGDSAEVFAARTGIGKSNLWRWAARYREDGPGKVTAISARPASGFAAVQVVADPGLRTTEVPGQALICELDGPCGLRLRVYQGADAAALRLLLDAVRGGARC